MTRYKKDLNNRHEYKLLKENAIIGLLGGVILFIWGLMGYLNNTGIAERMFVYLMYLGGLFFLCGFICPSLLYYPSKAFRAIGNIIGTTIFSIILGILYIVFILPVGLAILRKRKKYNMAVWNEFFDSSVDSTLSYKQKSAEGTSDIRDRYGIMHSVFRLFAYFYMNRQYIFIPVLCILVIIGLIFFFVSSTIIAPFIYTLF